LNCDNKKHLNYSTVDWFHFIWIFIPNSFHIKWKGPQRGPSGQSILHLASTWLVSQLLHHPRKASACTLRPPNPLSPWIFSPTDSKQLCNSKVGMDMVSFSCYIEYENYTNLPTSFSISFASARDHTNIWESFLSYDNCSLLFVV